MSSTVSNPSVWSRNDPAPLSPGPVAGSIAMSSNDPLLSKLPDMSTEITGATPPTFLRTRARRSFPFRRRCFFSFSRCLFVAWTSVDSCSGTTTSAVKMNATVATRPCAVTASNGCKQKHAVSIISHTYANENKLTCPMPVSVRNDQYSASPTSLMSGFVSYSKS